MSDNNVDLPEEPDLHIKLQNSSKRKRPHIPPYLFILPILSLAIIIFAFALEARTNRNNNAANNVLPVSDSDIQNELNFLNWVEQMFLPENRFTRPGTKLEQITGLVIHNIGNPNTTALQNRNYFANVAPAEEIFVSAHFIVCLDGKIIQCVPVDEIAYASNARNIDTISIEICHPDSTGKFTNESYEAAIKLAAWLSVRFDLTSNNIIRHFDVERESGPKACPLYFVENEDAWERFKRDVQNEINNLTSSAGINKNDKT